MSEVIRWHIGYDQREAVAYHTFCHSILARSTLPVSFTPIKLSMLKHDFRRKVDETQSNEFSYSRFLVPYLCDYQGWAVFSDCDMLMRVDAAELWALRDPDKAVMVVKHNYTPKDKTKYLGNKQEAYPRKNWSSVVLWNCSHPANRILTPGYVETATGATLHRFSWLTDSMIGELPVEWNHLVSEYAPNPQAKIVHWTVGFPGFHEYQHAEFADEWFVEKAQMQHCAQIQASTVWQKQK